MESGANFTAWDMPQTNRLIYMFWPPSLRSIPRREALPVGGKLHCSQINRRMGVEKILEPLAPAEIRSNVGEQGLNDQRDHVKAVVANAACLPCHGQFRLDGKFPIPQPAFGAKEE